MFSLRSAVTMASFMSAPQTSLHTSLQSSGSGPAVATVAGRGKKQVWNKSSRVTPADLQPPPDINTPGLPALTSLTATESLQEELKTKILLSSASKQQHQAGKRIEWPRGSIPRTVKKLSWDDETEKDRDREVPIFMDVDVSLTPSINTTRIQGDPVHLQ